MQSDDDRPITRREFNLVTNAHTREHQLHEKAHEVEHEMTQLALVKADEALENRLEGMNEFRAQLEKQAGQFLTREMFDQYTKELTTRTEIAFNNNADKYDSIIKAIVNRHDSDKDSVDSVILTTKESLQREIQSEREYRKTFEGSINTWKWIATFLGASGLAGVVIMFATRGP